MGLIREGRVRGRRVYSCDLCAQDIPKGAVHECSVWGYGPRERVVTSRYCLECEAVWGRLYEWCDWAGDGSENPTVLADEWALDVVRGEPSSSEVYQVAFAYLMRRGLDDDHIVLRAFLGA